MRRWNNRKSSSLGERVRINTTALLAWSAVALSAVSAFGVIWQTKVAADQREASVWPYVQAFPNRNSREPAFSISLVNVGVGPALIRYFSVRVDDKPVRSWRAFLEALSADEPVRQAYFGEGVIQGSGWVLAPNAPLTAFRTTVPEAVNTLDAPAWKRIDVTFCYCSVFDRCWLSAWAVSKRDDQPSPVRSCPSDGRFGVDWAELVTPPVEPKATN
jgi:hypothetical protein